MNDYAAYASKKRREMLEAGINIDGSTARSEAHRLASCAGKPSYDTAQEAHAITRTRNKRLGKKSRTPRLDAYRCEHCGRYHIGSSKPRGIKVARRKK